MLGGKAFAHTEGHSHYSIGTSGTPPGRHEEPLWFSAAGRAAGSCRQLIVMERQTANEVGEVVQNGQVMPCWKKTVGKTGGKKTGGVLLDFNQRERFRVFGGLVLRPSKND